MKNLYEELIKDVRLEEGLKACMNCGVCTAICPAAEFFEYDPRMIVSIVQTKDNEQIEKLLKGDTIWCCGQCMSCKTRCPRGNCPGLVINVLRKVSQELGYFTESKLGRQQYAIKKTIGENILKFGYCVYPDAVTPQLHPEQGPVWKWIYENRKEFFKGINADLSNEGAGTLRKMSEEAMNELKSIFDTTGGTDFYETIEKFSRIKAEEMGMVSEDGNMDRYFKYTYSE